jgi:hypothetical protein
VSLIGTLDQFRLAEVLQRLERHAKTGLLIIQQGTQWIEFYISDGNLLCVGPLRTQATLGERLVQDGVISQGALQETLLALGSIPAGESHMARKLIELRYVSRDALRSWTTRNTAKVLKVLLLWETGDIYFDEDAPQPKERLLVSMSLTSLIEGVTATMVPPTPAPAPTPFSYSPVNPPMPSSYSPVNPPMPSIYTPVAPPAAMQPPIQTPQPPSTPRTPSTPSPDVARVPTLMSASQFLDDSAFSTSSFATSFPSTESFSSAAFEEPSFSQQSDIPSFADVGVGAGAMFSDDGLGQNDSGFASLFGGGEAEVEVPTYQPVPISNPVPPRRIDTSFMVPEMVLLPKDLSAYREQNPQVQITPDQWCVLTHVDGRTSLLTICQNLGSTPDIVCPVVGELIAEELITISMPTDNLQPDLAPVSGELVASGLSNGYVAPGYASSAVSPWSASLPAMPQSDMNPTPFTGTGQVPGNGIVTESQWGNGGNGAKFVPGRGWITGPQAMQPLPSSGPLASPSGIYMPLGNDY